MAKPNPVSWSGPAATAFTHRVDLLEIELTVLCSLVSVAALNPTFGGSPGGKLPGGFGGGLGGIIGGGTPVVPLEQLISQLGLHF